MDQLEQAKHVYEMAPPAEEQSAYDYLPVWLDPYIPGLYKTEGEENPIVWVKFFTPDSSWTWYVIEANDPRIFGLVEGFETELGYFDLREISAARGPWGLRIERDLFWKPRRLSEVRNDKTG